MHTAEKLITTHLADAKATLASVGALYAVAMLSPVGNGAWTRINSAIMERFAPGDHDVGLKKLEAAKTHAWRLAEALTR